MQCRLFALAGNAHSPSDCFGWSACLLYPLRGKKKLGRHIPFIHQVARLVARIASAEVPAICGHILTCGDLVALHKLDAAQQAEAAAANKPPSLRPVNKGCNILKWALKLAVRSGPALAAARKLEPLQSGLAKRGPEAFCHSLRALREQGYAILKTDFRNGFNAISRQAVLDAVQRLCPELTALMNLFYTVDGACFFAVDGVVEVILSAEGVRMGCPLGSFGFDLALQAVLERCASRKSSAGIVVRSLTDDCNLAVRLPSDPAEADATLRRLHGALSKLAAHAKAALALDLNMAKCALLLPPGHAAAPDCFAGMEVSTRGTKVAGAPIGEDDFCAEFVGQKVDAALAKMRALRGIHPQAGMLLLRTCCLPQLNYLAQVVPPSLTVQHFARFDEGIASLVLELLTPPRGQRPPCSDERMGVFRRRLRLPMRLNGAGLIGVDSVGAAAFVGSVVASCEADRVLASNIGGLERFARPALLLLQARLAPLGATKVGQLLKLPLSGDLDLFDPSRYVEQDSDDKKSAPKLQQKWSMEVHIAAARTLRPDEDALGDSDLVHADARARPAAYILQAKLSNPFFRFSPADFISWFCFQFRIPQPASLGNADAAGVEQCLGSCRRRDVDLHGNHAHMPCKVCLRGRGHRHRYLKNVVSHHATKAGCIASWVREDSTSELLLRQFTPMQCSTMFPLNAPAALAEVARQVLKDVRSAAKLSFDQREAKLAKLDGRLQELRDSVVDGHGLRLDGTILHPASGEQVWFDVSAVHTTCKTHLKAEGKFTRERRAAGPEGAGQKSDALMEAHQGKLDRYALLAAMTQRQVLDGLRIVAPLILPVVVSTHGEFCPGTVQLQEWLVERYRARLRLEGDREDGEKEDDLITAFRCELRAALLVATAKGTAEMLAVAGRPFRKGDAQRTGAWPGARAAAARSVGNGADDEVISDSDNNNDSDSASASDWSCEAANSSSDTAADSDGSEDDSANPSVRRDTRPHSRSQRSAAPQTQGTRSSARLAKLRGPPQPGSSTVCAARLPTLCGKAIASNGSSPSSSSSCSSGNSSLTSCSSDSSSTFAVVVCDGFPVVM